MKRLFLFLACLLSLLAATAPALAEVGAGAGIQWEPGTVASVEVDKAERHMYLLDATGAVVKIYDITLGQHPTGAKEEEGDGKTPEGTYFIDGRNPKSDYNLSLHISYPNAGDIARAKKRHVSPGGDIFIHGKPNDRGWMFWHYNTRNNWTHGCIAVSNADIKEIWALVPDGTPITIKP